MIRETFPDKEQAVQEIARNMSLLCGEMSDHGLSIRFSNPRRPDLNLQGKLRVVEDRSKLGVSLRGPLGDISYHFRISTNDFQFTFRNDERSSMSISLSENNIVFNMISSGINDEPNLENINQPVEVTDPTTQDSIIREAKSILKILNLNQVHFEFSNISDSES